jgi:hypothetical protein
MKTASKRSESEKSTKYQHRRGNQARLGIEISKGGIIINEGAASRRRRGVGDAEII